MKIAIDISQIVYEGTGVAKYTRELVNNLLSIDKENEYVLFGLSWGRRNILTEYHREIENLNNKVSSKFFPIPQSIANTFWNRWHLVNAETFIGKVDIFHSSDWIQPPIAAKKITTVHDLVVYKYPEASHPYIIETQKRRLAWVKKECHMILTDSYATKNDLIKILHFDSDIIDVIYPGIGNEYRPVNEEEKKRIRQKYNLLDDYILTVGTIEPRKNLKAVLSAFERFLHHPLIASKKQPIEMVIVGKTGWGEGIKATKYIHQLGFVQQEDLPGLYSGATFFIYPSLYEGFGFPVIEAMACGTPVITSNRGSLEEITKDAAVIAEIEMPEDIAIRMTQLNVDDNLRKDLVKKGKENAARFTWKKTAEQVIAAYEKLYTG